MDVKKISDYCYEIPRENQAGMRVNARLYASEPLLRQIYLDKAIAQMCNVATLPGIVQYSLAMPDIHWGYGFPIGGVAATDIENNGVISPGGIGYDCNCGIRLLKTDLDSSILQGRQSQLTQRMFTLIPTGVGAKGALSLSPRELKKVLQEGSRWALKQGKATEDDILCTENHGRMETADPDILSARAIERGLQQIGTLGSGNHFVEVQVVEEIFDAHTAAVMGLFKEQITVMIHTGSRGLGYQVCDDYIRKFRNAPKDYGYSLPDRQLVCAPFNSPEGTEYFAALSSAANFAWANRQILTHLMREIFERFFDVSPNALHMDLVYDVAHNIAKIEDHILNGKKKRLCVHRKGATRAFPADHTEIPLKYKTIGQPVIVPGDMGSASYVLVGTQTAMNETFGSVCHGAGRAMSRAQAIKHITPQKLRALLEKANVSAQSVTIHSLLEEAPGVYKDINQVIDVVCGAQLARKVAKMKPLCVIKG